MYTSFEEKKTQLLGDLKTLALRHNREYYISLIPHVENATSDQEDLIDMYLDAVGENRWQLMQSRDALVTVARITSLI